jgi:hypothetical protein
VELTQEFHQHLREHAVPLEPRAISSLRGNSLGLDLYVLLAYRLPKISRDKPEFLPWRTLLEQIGVSLDTDTRRLRYRVGKVEETVRCAYPQARFECGARGIRLFRSEPPVPPNSRINGFRLIDSKSSDAD